MLTILELGFICITLLNLFMLASLALSYGWNDWLKPRLANRRARQRAFERLIAHTTLDIHSMLAKSNDAGELLKW